MNMASFKQEHPFTALSREELLSAAMLFQEPLYKYCRRDSEELHVLFVGTGSYMDRMLRTTLVAGQMLNRRLHAHVMAPDAEAYRAELLSSASGLAHFSNISGEVPEEEQLVRFEFRNVKGLNTRAGSRTICGCLEDCRYIVVDLEKKDVLLGGVAAACASSVDARLVCFTGETAVKPGGRLRFRALDKWDAKAQETIVRLGRQAFRLSYYYDRQYGSVGQSMAESMENFRAEGNAYNQRANLLAALHAAYKLASIGANPAAQRRTIMAKCAKLLYGPDRGLFDELAALEHRRWMMEKLLAEFRSPSYEEMLLYCYNGEKMNDKWWNDDQFFHNCLKPSKPRSQSSLHALTPADWERCAGQGLTQAQALERIAQSGLDPLDQMSLTVHYLAGQKMKETKAAVERALQELHAVIDLRLSSLPDECELPQRPDAALTAWAGQAEKGSELHRADEMAALLRSFASAALLPRGQIDRIEILLKRLAKLAKEFYRLKDYKCLDEEVVEQTLRLYTMPSRINLVKFGSESMLENIASALLIEPETLIVTDLPEGDLPNVAAFFEGRGDFLKVVSKPLDRRQAGQRLGQLKRLIRSYSGDGSFCVVDATGADGVEMLKIVDFVRTEGLNAAVITCDCGSQRITSLYNFPEADCMRAHISLRVEEVFNLLGTSKQHRMDEGDALEMRMRWQQLWAFYKKNAAKMGGICALVRAMVNYSDKNRRSPLFAQLPETPRYVPFRYENRSLERFEALRIEQLLTDLKGRGFVQELQIHKPVSGRVDYSGTILEWMNSQPCVKSLLDLSAEHPLKVVPAKNGAIRLDFANPEDRRLYVNAEFSTGCFKAVKLRQHAMASTGDGLSESRLLRLLSDMESSGQISEYNVRTATASDSAAEGEFVKETSCTFMENDPEMMYLAFENAKGERKCYSYPAAEIVPLLREMNEARLIYAVRAVMFTRKTGEKALQCSFRFTSEADRNHLAAIGSFLESRVYAEAVATGCFDDVRTNYKFAWDQDTGTENEFDVLMTKGLRVFIVSCKATESMKEHLYEISSLARRFARTAQPVIVYADKKRVKEKDRLRAKTMGVLIAYAEGGNEDETVEAVLRNAVQNG